MTTHAPSYNQSNDLDEEVTRNFEKICQREPLARTLHRVKIVDVDINVVYNLVADLKGYSSWMPWCTAGSSTQKADETEYFGDVAFGIQCPPFGAIQDHIKYRMNVEPPSEDSNSARVIATCTQTQ